MEREVYEVRCTGRCRAYTPHARLEVIKPDRQAAWRVRCLACDGTAVLWTAHRAGAPGRAACGAALLPPVRLASAPAEVTCPPCAADLWRLLESRSGEEVGRCLRCARPATFARSLWLDPAGVEVRRRRCLACGLEERTTPPRHAAPSAQATWCGLPNDSRVRAVVPPLHADCPGCLWGLLREPGRQVAPDWRPAAAVAEDFYAL